MIYMAYVTEASPPKLKSAGRTVVLRDLKQRSEMNGEELQSPMKLLCQSLLLKP